MVEQTDYLKGLVQRVEKEEPGAFEALLEHFQGSLETWIRLRLGDRLRTAVEPADIFQETMLRALRAASGFQWQGETAFANWLARIAENVIREQVRGVAKHGHAVLDDEPADGAVSPSRVARRGERFERLQRALDALDPISRRVVELSRLEGRSLKEIAELVGRSPNAVALVVMRALRKLREHLGDTESLGLPDRALRSDSSEDDESRSV